MKLLVIAYEFPPILSGQSVRWFHLVNAMARLGAEVHILAPTFPNLHGFRGEFCSGVHVHRCTPGPFVGLAARLAERIGSPTARREGTCCAKHDDTARNLAPSTRYRALEHVYRITRAVLDRVLFPDVRTEWFPFGAAALRKLLSRHRYDVIISSHEPGVTLLIGLAAKRRWQLPWLVDLGDPLVGLRSLRWRERLDLALERAICRRADGIVVTCPDMVQLLLQRHGSVIGPCALRAKLGVVSQGFSPSDAQSNGTQVTGWPDAAESHLGPADNRTFTLLFTGTFHSPFRDPRALADALAELGYADLRLVFAGNTGPLDTLRTRLGDRVRVLGMIDHLDCLALQQRATMLLSAGTARPYQVPGKVFEYLGANRPILHLTVGEVDPSAILIQRLRRGLAVPDERTAIAEALRLAYGWWQEGRLDGQFDLSPEAVTDYAWPSLAARFLRECERAQKSNSGEGA